MEGSEFDRNIAAMNYADIDSSSHLPVDLPVSVDVRAAHPRPLRQISYHVIHAFRCANAQY